MSKLRVKAYVEVYEDGEVIRRETLPEGDRMVAMIFSDQPGSNLKNASVAITGCFNRSSVVELAATTANAVCNITKGHPDAPALWEIFENTLHKTMKRIAESEADNCEKELREELKKQGVPEELIEKLMDATKKAAEAAFNADNNREN